MDSLKIEPAVLGDFYETFESNLECFDNCTCKLDSHCIKDQTYEANIKCGEIVLEFNKKFTLVCARCPSEFDHLETFGQHVYANHLEIDQNYEYKPFECLYLEEKVCQQLSAVPDKNIEKENTNFLESINSNCMKNSNQKNNDQIIHVVKYHSSTIEQNGVPLDLKFESPSCMRNICSLAQTQSDEIASAGHTNDKTTCSIKCGTIDPLPVKYPCSICNTEYRHKHSYIAHARKHHAMITTSMKNRIGNDAGKLIGVINRIIRKKELRKARKTNMYRCPKCDCGYNNHKALIYHVGTTHGTNTLKGLLRRYPCKYCGEESANIEERQRHELIRHSVDAKYDCSYCDKSFKSYDGRRIHIYSHTGESPYKCPYCPKGFTVSANLKTHIFMHLQIKNYTCKYCNKKFVQSTDRNIHEARHTGNKPFQCEVCGKQFITSTLLCYHRRRHQNMGTYKCNLCDKSYFTSTSLKYHIARHKGESIYKCSTCARSFKTCKNLKEHERIHKFNGIFFVCACGKNFKQRSTFNNHRKSHASMDRPTTIC